ncbi:MAG TPA: gliding motility-associated C-terminal domain-containing protein [Saprospiraceae bacterium]|nr:gliding motility-associated C-terminal domain-containing protein [Saprospiraceae bacterium]
MSILYVVWALLTNMQTAADDNITKASYSASLDCNCTITQSGSTYPVSALLGSETAATFYSYGIPNVSSANTGLEISNGLILFLYEDTNTGIISLFLIADIANDGTGGEMEFEVNCLPDNAFVSVQDDPGEFNGAPPLVTGNWTWSDCCTDGGVIEDIGCNNTLNLDLLVANGLDSILWLTGDIAAPDQILLNMNGDAITINCGGGVCCPVGFDTEILITNATCPDVPDGSIDISPKDGLAPYTFIWSNGATTEDLVNVIHGTYDVTITDSQGCMDELTITVALSPGIPPAEPASITLCSESSTAVFDLTSIEGIINLGMGFTVLWFQNADLTGAIGNPSSYESGTTTVYAVVDNGSCQSDPVPIDLEVIMSPVANTASLNACEEENGMATFDLIILNDIVSGGNGSVSWYLDANLSIPISDPTQLLSGSATVYAVVNDGTCISDAVEIQLIVDPKPVGNATGMSLCGDEYDEAEFDLTLLDNTIGGGTGSVEWYYDEELTEPILNLTEFLTNSTTVYATVFDGVCYSDAIPIVLTVEQTPQGNPLTAELCDDGTSMALFNLWDYDSQVSGGQGGVDWYYDVLLQDLIPFPDAFYTTSTIVYATVDNGICISAPVEVTLSVITSPVGNPTFIETCAGGNGEGIFNLTSVDNDVSGGVGTVLWFEDAQGNLEIDNDTAYVSTGSTVYAQISNGVCVSGFVPVNLIIVDSVSASPTLYEVCDDGSGIAVFNLLNIEDEVSSGSGQVNWFLDSLGTMVIISPETFQSGDTIIYANVTAGACISDIVPVTLMTLPSPEGFSTSTDLCGNANGVVIIDLTTLDTIVSGNSGDVLWFVDALLSMPIADPTTFMTGDTTIYASVLNGVCISPPAVVIIFVSMGLSANPDTMELCISAGDTLSTDLTQSDLIISGGSGQVNWFTDSLGMAPIMTPASFPVSASVTVFANVSDGNCVSELVAVELEVVASPVATPVAIQRCGDANGQVTVDLTTYDVPVSGNTGIVTWYADPALSMAIVNTGAFMSGDTVVYAIVTNGFCVSAVASVILEVVDSLTATAITIAECVIGTGSATLNLTQSEFDISGGGGTVYWFTDILGTDTITNTTAFVSGDNTIYAVVAADGCISNIAPVTIDIANADMPLLDCVFSSIDSIAVSWTTVTTDYELSYAINGQVIGVPWISQSTAFGLGGLAQGDTLTLWVTALFGFPCMPLTNSITCITEMCPAQTVEFIGLASAYCRDEDAILITTNPPGGQLSGQGIVGATLDLNLVVGGSTVIFYTWEDIASGCVYDISAPVQIYDPLSAPVLNCQLATLSSVTFDWNATAGQFGYQYAINQGATAGPFTTGSASLLIDNLNEGDEVTLTVWSVGAAPCGNSDTVSISCFARQCPAATLIIQGPGIICENDTPFQLNVEIQGPSGNPIITWSGQGITDPSGTFDPMLVGPGQTTVTVIVEIDGCTYTESRDMPVTFQPDATFEVEGIPCLDSVLHVTYTGMAFLSSQWNWNLGGAELVSGSLPVDFSLQWSDPGDYTLNLEIDWNGCISEPFSIPVHIDAPLGTPVITCVEEDYFSLTIEWENIGGASSYSATSSLGTGILSGNTYTVRNLPDDTTVNITVIATGVSTCGPTSSTIQCQTLKYIPVTSFIPNIFSPNGDGVNDILYIQSNSEITEVSVFRVFDRWGDVVFEDFNFLPNDQQHGWDGTHTGKEMNPGVFVYWARLQTTRGESIVVGDVMVVR